MNRRTLLLVVLALCLQTGLVGLAQMQGSASFFQEIETSTGNVFLAELLPRNLDAEVADTRITGADCRDQFGRTIAVGDVNDDGVTDLVVGAFLGNRTAEKNPGLVHILFGPVVADDVAAGDFSGTGEQCWSSNTVPAEGVRDLGLSAASITVVGGDDIDRLGFSVDVADVDGDGIGDVLLGADQGDGPSDSRTQAGAAYVFLGRTSWPAEIDLDTESADLEIHGADRGDRLGNSLRGGDVTGDGQADLVVAARAADGEGNVRSSAGEVYVFNGPVPTGTIDLRTDEPDTLIIGPDVGDFAGTSLALGHVNDDDVLDLLIGAPGGDGPGNDRSAAGEVHVLHGSTSLTGASDDGVAAPATADPGAEEGNWTRFITDPYDGLRAVLQEDGSVAPGIELTVPELGTLRKAVEDPVWAVWNRTDPQTLDTHVIDLATSPGDLVVYGPDAEDELGAALGARDLDADGTADLALTAPGGDGPTDGRNGAGEAYLLRGGPWVGATWDLATEPANTTVFGNESGDRLGGSLGIGHVNGDDLPDIALGAATGDGLQNGAKDAGQVHVLLSDPEISGDRDLSTDPAWRTIYGADADDRFGAALLFVDIDDDPEPELLVGAPLADTFTDRRFDAGELLLYERATLRG